MRVHSMLRGLTVGATGLLATIAFAEPAPMGAKTDEITTRTGVRDDGARMVRQRDFAGIDAAARRYREDGTRTPSGTSVLAEFYAGIEVELGYGQRESGCAYTAGPVFEAWQRADPEAPTPYILEAEMLSNYGWCLRGSGSASKVSEDSWAPFYRQLAMAETILNRHRNAAAADPAFYAALLDIYNDSGKGESDYRTLLDEAVARHPGYPNIYFNAARHYLPQWGGSYEAVDALARRAERELPRAGNAGGYVRVYWYLIGCGCFDHDMPIDRLLLRRSMSETLARFPDNWNVANFAMIACRTDDPLAAQGYFKALPTDYDPKWHDPKWWQFCREVAGVTPTKAGA
jgi:hypothetical protein